MADSLAEALAALATEEPCAASSWPPCESVAKLVPHVAAIIDQLPPLPEKLPHVERSAGRILEAYVNGCWQVRQEADPRVADQERAELQARLKALQATIADLSDGTRRGLDRDLAVLARRLWYLWNEDERWHENGTWNQDGQHKLGLARSLLELNLLVDATRQWTERERGRPDNHVAAFIACAALEVYRELTGLPVNRNFDGNRDSHAFLVFLGKLYGLLDVDLKGVENRAREAVKELKTLHQ